MQRKKPDTHAWQKLINDILANTSMTQRQLAKKIKVAPNSIHGWLNGRTRPRPKHQLDLIEYCMDNRLGNLCKKYQMLSLVKEVKNRRFKAWGLGVPNDDDYFYI